MLQAIPYMLKSAIILIILFAYYQLFLRRNTFYAANRIYLLGSILLAIVLPLLNISISSEDIVVTPEPTISIFLGELQTIGSQGLQQLTTSGSVPLLIWIYLAGVGYFFLRYFHSLTRLIRLILHHPVKRLRNILIVLLPAEYPICSFFNILFINNTIKDRGERRRIFEHEKMHILQWHSLDLLIADLFCIFNWFNPMAWLIKKAMAQNHEYIADHQVIKRYETNAYLQLLLKQTLRGNFSFINYFACTNLKKRIVMMTKKQTPISRVLLYLPALLLCFILFLNFSCSSNKKMEAPTTSDTPAQISNQEEDRTFVMVEQMPVFSEGDVVKWIAKNTRYPKEAFDKKIEGRVFVKFVVEKDGSTSNIQIVRGVDSSLDNEVIRMIQSMPKWSPGKQKDKTVRVSFTVPVNFYLQNQQESTTSEELGQIITHQVTNVSREEVSEEATFVVAEQMPVFPEGDVSKWVANKVQQGEGQRVSGRVFVKFIVEKDGSVSNVKVLRGIDPLVDKEAVRIIQSMPKWQAGKQKGEAVRVSFTIPVNFPNY